MLLKKNSPATQDVRKITSHAVEAGMPRYCLFYGRSYDIVTKLCYDKVRQSAGNFTAKF